jgi:hypothetical protein
MRFAAPVTFVAIVAIALPLSAAATGSMKPGLWEMTMKSDMFKQMPEIPAAQREQMRQMGIELPEKRGDTLVQKVCITPEMAARDQFPTSGHDMQSGCKLKNQNRSGSSYRAEMVCDNPNMKGTGVIQGSFSGNERFTSSYEFKGTVDGKAMTHRQESSGKWLASSCGNVKPMGQGMGGP